MDLVIYSELRALARRCSARADEAEDLLQDTLLAALQAGRSDLPWLVGTMQKQAAMAARGAVRRRQREAVAVLETAAIEAETSAMDACDADERRNAVDALPGKLPPAARRVALLALHGLSAEEIRWILGITPAAFRQRLTSIRKALGDLSPARRAESLALAYLRDPARSVELQFGLLRRHLQAVFAASPGLGTHDPDGHLLVIRRDAQATAPGGNEPVIPERSGAG